MSTEKEIEIYEKSLWYMLEQAKEGRFITQEQAEEYEKNK